MTRPLSYLSACASKRNLSALAIGKATGLSHVTVREALAGETDPRLSTMEALSAYLGARVRIEADREVSVRHLRTFGPVQASTGPNRTWRDELRETGADEGNLGLPGRQPRLAGALQADGFYAGKAPATHMLRLNFPGMGGSAARLDAEVIGAWLASAVLGSARVLRHEWLPFYRLKADPTVVALANQHGADPRAGVVVARHDTDFAGVPSSPEVVPLTRLLGNGAKGTYPEQLDAVLAIAGPEAVIDLLERMLVAQLLGVLGLAPHKTSVDFAAGALRPWSSVPAGALLYRTTDYLGPSVSPQPHTQGLKASDILAWWERQDVDARWAAICRGRLASVARAAHEQWPEMLTWLSSHSSQALPELPDVKRSVLLARLEANQHLRTEFGTP